MRHKEKDGPSLKLKTAKAIVEQTKLMKSMGGIPNDPRLNKALEIVSKAATVTTLHQQRAQENDRKRLLAQLLRDHTFPELVQAFCARPSMRCLEFREPDRCMYHDLGELQQIIIKGECLNAWVNFVRGTMTREGGFVNPRIPQR